MKTTAFTQYHIDLGAKMAPFAGYNMPIEYKGINIEHAQVRSKVGVFDVSHMGEFWVKGPKAQAFVQYCTSNDVTLLKDGKVQYSCLPNGKGGIVDDLLVYRFAENEYFLVPNAANIDKDFAHLSQFAPKFGLEVGKDFVNASAEYCQLAVQGPKAMEVMQKICNKPIMDMEYYTFQVLNIAGIEGAILSTTGYTGAGGCEVYVKNEFGPQLWKAVFEAGKEFDIMPIGLGARDTLRLEMGFCLYGNDICDTTSPLEAGLGWITKFTNKVTGDIDFVDREFLMKQKAEGLKRKLVGFEMIDKGIPRHEYEICDAEGNTIGHVTSGTMSPSMKKGVGMGYVAIEHAALGSEIYIKVRDRKLKAQVVRPPFYKAN